MINWILRLFTMHSKRKLFWKRVDALKFMIDKAEAKKDDVYKAMWENKLRELMKNLP